MRTSHLVSILAGIILSTGLGALPVEKAPEAPSQTPVDIGKAESVEVRLVTVDVIVLDKDDRTVPGLTADDFDLEVDGMSREVDTLDETCPEGAAGRPLAGHLADRKELAATGEAPRRIVFAFDYLHLTELPCADGDSRPCLVHTEVLSKLQRALRDQAQGDEEIMIVVLDGALRVEQPFTRDRAQVIETLARMKNDITLWAGHFQHLNETGLFSGLETLVELLDIVPGSKAMVLFSGGAGPSDSYDRDYRRLTDLAALARVSFYPIDCQGLGAKRFT